MNPNKEIAVFDDPRNINRGTGRIIYAEQTTDRNGKHHPEGWVLPGGVRTQSREVAETAADRINNF